MSDPRDIAAQLLEAHVAHQLAELQGPRLSARIDQDVRALFEWLAAVKLNDVVTRGHIIAVISRYVIDLKISGAFAELAGEMSRLVVASPVSERTRVDDVLQAGSFTQFADKVAALDGLWRELIHVVLQSDAYATLLSRMLQRGLLDVVFRDADAATQRSFVDELLAGVRPLLEQRVEPFVSSQLEALIKRLARRGERRLLVALDPAAARALIDEVWDAIGPMRLSDAFAFLGSGDLEDFVVLVYEFWQRYRKTPYFREISSALVDHFFDKYGDDSVLGLLDDLGITAEIVTQELQSFLSTLVGHASATGFLEERIRQHLAPFYRSDAALAIFAATAGSAAER